jgi:serine/threonine protein kinase
MSLTQTSSQSSSSGSLQCRRCHSPLPKHATFCGTCGERVEQHYHGSSPDHTDVADRYRITSLVRRHPYVQLFLALDQHYQRPVAIRDIDISGIHNQSHTRAIDAVQHEYDLLRRERIPDLMPAIDLRYFQDHLFVVQGWPFPLKEQEGQNTPLQRHSTLHDLLQSGIGLPAENTALTWIYRLCRVVACLHSHQIVIGDLDPHAIVVSDNDYSSTLSLMISWLPTVLREILPSESAVPNATPFSAPETLSGTIEPRSDLYSLGAILYLLLTGNTPSTPDTQDPPVVCPPRELNARISGKTEDLIMRALERESVDRFESAAEMADALQNLLSGSNKRVDKTTNKKENDSGDPSHDVTVVLRSSQMRQARKHLEQLLAKGQKNIPSTDSKEKTEKPELLEIQESTEILASPIEQRDYDIAQEKTQLLGKEEVHEAIQKARGEKEINDTQTENTPVTHTPAEEATQEAPPTDEEIQGAEVTQQISPQKENRFPAPPQDTEKHAEEVQGKPDQERAPAYEQPEVTEPPLQSLRRRLTGKLPALPRLLPNRSTPLQVTTQPTFDGGMVHEQEQSFFKKLQHFFLGEQQHNTGAVALIETPLRVQPQQNYNLRINIMGRNEPGLPPGIRSSAQLAGLSALASGDVVHIEVRSALYQNYAYVVQQADVQIPAQNYAAEVTIPLQALGDGPSGRRERLHIFFMDRDGNPLYEKPFVIELFVSHLVQPGREGHNVLPIPL